MTYNQTQSFVYNPYGNGVVYNPFGKEAPLLPPAEAKTNEAPEVIVLDGSEDEASGHAAPAPAPLLLRRIKREEDITLSKFPTFAESSLQSVLNRTVATSFPVGPSHHQRRGFPSVFSYKFPNNNGIVVTASW